MRENAHLLSPTLVSLICALCPPASEGKVITTEPLCVSHLVQVSWHPFYMPPVALPLTLWCAHGCAKVGGKVAQAGPAVCHPCRADPCRVSPVGSAMPGVWQRCAIVT